LTKDENTLFLTSYNGSFYVYNVTDPTNPTKVSMYKNSSLSSIYYEKIILSEDETTAYIADYHNGLWILNVQNASSGVQPSFISIYKHIVGASYNCLLLSANGELIYITDYTNSSLILLNVTDSELGIIPT
jgi:hypothetical protein